MAAAMEAEDPAIGEPVGDLRAARIARGAGDRADRGVGVDVTGRRGGPPRSGQRSHGARERPGRHPLADPLRELVTIHAGLPDQVEAAANSVVMTGRVSPATPPSRPARTRFV